MPRALPVSVIHQNIYDQLQSSRDIFAQIRRLGEIVGKLQIRKNDEPLTDDITNPTHDITKVAAEVADHITNVMQRLLVIGQQLSDRAKETALRAISNVSAPFCAESFKRTVLSEE